MVMPQSSGGDEENAAVFRENNTGSSGNICDENTSASCEIAQNNAIKRSSISLGALGVCVIRANATPN